MTKSRLIGEYPVIGIRPTIDGRRGVLNVRGSLEEQTMNMAKSAAKLFKENLKYTNGEPVKVVISNTTIGRVAEAAECERQFKKEGVDITLTVTPCWCYGAETMDMNPNTIKGVWGFNGTERPGAVYLASVLATHTQKGLPAFGIYGKDVQEADDTSIPEDVKEKLLRFGRAAIAVSTMKGKSYLQIGSICMGIGGSMMDPNFMEDYLGLRVESVDEVEIIRRMSEGIYDEDEFKKAMKDISKITGLSSGTISRYINNNGYVSKESAKKIQSAIDELNYIPNEHARVLYSKSTKVIGLIVPSLVNPFFAQMATVLESILNKNGYSIILYNTNDDMDEEINALKMLQGFRVDGIITGRSQNKELLKKLNIPVVSFESEIGDNVVNITANNFLGGEIAFKTLYERGCRNLLHIRGPKIFEATEKRYEGFISQAKNHSDAIVDVISISEDYSTDFNIDKILDDINLKKYDGIFVFNDIAAASTMSYILKKGFKVPEDIQILGFDNSYIAELLNPKLSSVEQPVKEIAKECVKVLLKLINKEEVKEKTIRIKTNVVLRESTINLD